ncbi:MAG: hypothetical protein RL385_5619 [Pseudomonadota bacterium]|jgi:hypothetical protein
MPADPAHPAARRARVHGYLLLLASAALGFVLEACHALKLARYLDVPLRRSLLTWAHAHGVGLALVLLAFAATGVTDEASARAGRTLFAGSVLMPLGFLLGSLDLHESDPGIGILLVPVGALCVLRALYVVARAALRDG